MKNKKNSFIYYYFFVFSDSPDTGSEEPQQPVHNATAGEEVAGTLDPPEAVAVANGLDQDVAAAGGDDILPAAAQDTPQPVGKAVEETSAATEPVSATVEVEAVTETLPTEEVVTQPVPDPHSEPVAVEAEATVVAAAAEATEQVTVVTSPVSDDVIGNNNDKDYENLRVEARKIVDRTVYLAEKIVTGKKRIIS